MIDKQIIHNKAQCLACGDVIESKHRHDFVTCKCGGLSVDGGLDYLKRTYGQVWTVYAFKTGTKEFKKCPVKSIDEALKAAVSYRALGYDKIKTVRHKHSYKELSEYN